MLFRYFLPTPVSQRGTYLSPGSRPTLQLCCADTKISIQGIFCHFQPQLRLLDSGTCQFY